MIAIALKIKLEISEVTDVGLGSAAQPLTIHLLTSHTAGTLTFLRFLKSTTLFCLEVFVLLFIFQKDSPTLPLAKSYSSCLSQSKDHIL